MIYRGTVKGNMVMLEPGAQLPDGTSVHVETDESSVGNGLMPSQSDLFQIGEQVVETGIPDLATNADHYLYGHPKVSHAG
jgi:hypothetical protein